MKSRFVDEFRRDEAQATHRFHARGDAEKRGLSIAPEAFARGEDCRDDDCAAMHRAALESVVEVFAVGGRTADHRRVLGAKAAGMPDRGAGTAAVDARDERPDVIAAPRGNAQAADVDEQILATQPDSAGNAS